DDPGAPRRRRERDDARVAREHQGRALSALRRPRDRTLAGTHRRVRHAHRTTSTFTVEPAGAYGTWLPSISVPSAVRRPRAPGVPEFVTEISYVAPRATRVTVYDGTSGPICGSTTRPS